MKRPAKIPTKMDFNDPDSSMEFDGEHEKNEVVPSSETSISDNELTTTIAEHKQSSTVDVPSNGTKSSVKNQSHTSNRKVFETTAIEQQESDGGGSTAGIKSESDTESESRLVIQSENETTDNDTASTLATTTIKENGGSVSLKSSAKRKSSAKLNNKQAIGVDDNFDDGNFSDDEEKFHGFTADDINKCTSWGNAICLFVCSIVLHAFHILHRIYMSMCQRKVHEYHFETYSHLSSSFSSTFSSTKANKDRRLSRFDTEKYNRSKWHLLFGVHLVQINVKVHTI